MGVQGKYIRRKALSGISKSTGILTGLSIVLSFLLMLYAVEYSTLNAEYENLYAKYQDAEQALREKESQLQSANQKIERLTDELESVAMKYQELSDEYSRLRGSYESLKVEYEDIKASYDSLKEQYERLQLDYDTLMLNYTNLWDDYIRLMGDYVNISSKYHELLMNQTLYQLKFYEQIKEVLYYRQFIVYDYKHKKYYMPYVLVHAFTYWRRRSDVNRHIPYLTLNYTTLKDYYDASLKSWREDWPIKYLAHQLRQIAGDDDELYANLALQVVHELYYNVTDYTKYPIETVVEGSGDCDSLSVLLASLLEAGGLDAIVLIGYAKSSQEEGFGGGHAMVAVRLAEEPDDWSRKSYWYYMYRGKKYWVMEATWLNPEETVTFPWQYEIIGSAVGDLPWDSFEVRCVIDA